MSNWNKAHINIKQVKTIDKFFSFVDEFHSFNSRQIEGRVAYTNYFKYITFQKRRFMKNESFTTFWFVGSTNWFMIHESRTLNSCSALYAAIESIELGKWKIHYILQKRKKVSTSFNCTFFYILNFKKENSKLHMCI